MSNRLDRFFERHILDHFIKQARLNDLKIRVLKINKGSKILDFPDAECKLELGDILIVYGELRAIEQLRG